MTKYERLQDDIENSETIYVERESDIAPAIAIKYGGNYGIFFDESAYETTAERRIALAHEKAHCDTGAVYSVSSPEMTWRVCEARAWRRTIQDVMPFDELVEVFERCVYADGLDVYELAEKLDVTPEFAKRAIEHYHKRGKRW